MIINLKTMQPVINNSDREPEVTPIIQESPSGVTTAKIEHCSSQVKHRMIQKWINDPDIDDVN